MNEGTVSRAMRSGSFESRGVIKLVRAYNPETDKAGSNRYRLVIPQDGMAEFATASPAGRGRTYPVAICAIGSGGGEETVALRDVLARLGHDAFRTGSGFPRGALFARAVLATHGPMTANALAIFMGKHRRTTGRWLKELARYGEVRRIVTDDGKSKWAATSWLCVRNDVVPMSPAALCLPTLSQLDRIAEERGTKGRGAYWRNRFALDRIVYRFQPPPSRRGVAA